MTYLLKYHDTAVIESSVQPATGLTNLVQLLEYHARRQPQTLAYQYLVNGEEPGDSLTYYQLQQKAQAIAAHLQSYQAQGERALLVYQPGLEFISAFFGCLYAGVIAVPIYPPRRNQNKTRLDCIINNSQARFILGTTASLTNLEQGEEDLSLNVSSVKFIDTNKIETGADNWQRPFLDSQSIAFLQYTSGSTGTPKGVIVSHGNLLHNEEMIAQAFCHYEQEITYASWLPLFHDMGLIGNVLQSLYLGVSCILMSPVDFLQKPVRWLEMISRYQATTSGGPNFAYDLCIRKITPEQIEGLDLSSWNLAFNGSEPIRAKTLEDFAAKFAPAGFRPEAFYPCYGMAEATLFMTGGFKKEAAITMTVDEAALAENRIIPTSESANQSITLVGCGHIWLDEEIIIVNPDTLKPCATNEVGEIWVAGKTVALGYWQQAEKTQETFQARLADSHSGPYLRTGDLGFVREDRELFVTGRLKDVVIIRGRNHYPQDIEKTLEQAHTALVPHRSAAFSLDVAGEERLVVVAEVERRYRDRRAGKNEDAQVVEQRKYQRRTDHIDPGFEVDLPEPPIYQEIVTSIRQAIAAHHGLQAYGVVLLRVGTIPKTSSGKIQRYLCRKGFQEQSLTVVYCDTISV
jgi:acyl-CoA synthetase (AMP-forming)/AMP-acid ligase II